MKPVKSSTTNIVDNPNSGLPINSEQLGGAKKSTDTPNTKPPKIYSRSPGSEPQTSNDHDRLPLPPRGGMKTQSVSDDSDSTVSTRSAPTIFDEAKIRQELDHILKNAFSNESLRDTYGQLYMLARHADDAGLKLIIDAVQAAPIPYDFLGKIGSLAIKLGNVELFDRIRSLEPDIQFTEAVEINFKPRAGGYEGVPKSDILKELNMIKMYLKDGASISEYGKRDLIKLARQQGDQELVNLLEASAKTVSQGADAGTKKS